MVRWKSRFTSHTCTRHQPYTHIQYRHNAKLSLFSSSTSSAGVFSAHSVHRSSFVADIIAGQVALSGFYVASFGVFSPLSATTLIPAKYIRLFYILPGPRI